MVDPKGKPIEGVSVHVWDWVDRPENKATTGADGVFRFPDCGAGKQVQIRYRKAGLSPVMAVTQPTGVKGLVVVLDAATYFEGAVTRPDGRPAAGAVIRADQGMKRHDGGVISHVWTEATADAAGRYRLYVEPAEYEFHVKLPGVGVARLPRTGIAHGQARAYDVRLAPAVTFTANVVDSFTGKPAAGVRLFDWRDKSVSATSDAAGRLTIGDMLPGEFAFTVESKAHARWWSERAVNPWERKEAESRKGTGWQRNFDGLTFDLKPGMAAVTVAVEAAVTLSGRVVDPDGKPVGGATVAPALTGSNNSLTGDTRFSVPTGPDGAFTMSLPASGAAKYNLVAHDGEYQEWRTWANGVLPPVTTAPGQAVANVTLTLTRPATVRGKVVDAQGRPVAGREVYARPADAMENRYYDPTATTAADGTFELKFLRPTAQLIRPHYDAAESPVKVTLAPGQVAEGVTLVAEPAPAK